MTKTEFELFEEWAVAKGHYATVAAIARFKLLQKTRKGDEPILVDKLQDED